MKTHGLRLLIAFLVASHCVNATETLQVGRFGEVTLYAKTKTPQHVVLFVSGDGGYWRFSHPRRSLW